MGVSRRIGEYLWHRRSMEPQVTEQGLRSSETEPEGSRTRDAATAVAIGEQDQPFSGREMEEEVGTMDEERMQILRMVEEHKITAEEAGKLLATLDSGSRPAGPVAGKTPGWLRVRVTDTATGRVKVNVNVPMGVVSAAGKLGARFGLGKLAEKEGIDLDELFEAIRSGAEGKLVDVTDEDGREHVEVYLE